MNIGIIAQADFAKPLLIRDFVENFERPQHFITVGVMPLWRRFLDSVDDGGHTVRVVDRPLLSECYQEIVAACDHLVVFWNDDSVIIRDAMQFAQRCDKLLVIYQGGAR
jgi:hypothetical protein